MPNLLDNKINLDFKLNDFITQTEASEYISKIPGIQDIISKGQGLIDGVKGFIMEIQKLIDQIKAYFDLDRFLDALGLKKFVDTIFKFVSENLLPLGFPAELKERYKDLFTQTCGKFQSSMSNAYGTMNIDFQSVSLMGILLAMLCSGITNAFSSLVDVFKSKGEESISHYSDLEKAEYVVRKAEKDKQVDKLFGITLSPLFSSSLSLNIGLIDDLNKHPDILKIAGQQGNVSIPFLKKVDTMTHDGESKSDTYTIVMSTFGTLNNQQSLDKDTSDIKNSTGLRSLAGGYNQSKVVTLDNISTPIPELATFILM